VFSLKPISSVGSYIHHQCKNLTSTANCIEAVEKKPQGYISQGTGVNWCYISTISPSGGNVQQIYDTAVKQSL